MKIRPARAADFAVLAAIAETVYRRSFDGIMSPAALAGRTRGHFERRFAGEPVAPVLAEDGDGKALGFHLTQDGKLAMLFVDPAAQARGIGAALLADAEARGAVRLDCFRDNAPARAFYEKRGWTLARGYEREFAGDNHAFVEYVKASR
ncbi:MAG: GNAT family N-acetyltransferase [Tagaea sp.]|nr:GNAT family N-acetyltransferase [Tagaea sp.]